MKKTLILLLTNFLFVNYVYNQTVNKKAVFVIVDGIPTDILYKVYTPNIDAIAKDGVLLESYIGGITDTYSETSTYSANGYATIITGTWGNKHNVYGNDIKNPNYNYPTIFRLYKDNYPNHTIAVYSSWVDNRKKLIGENLPQTNNLKIDYHHDGMDLDTINYPHDQNDNYVKRIDADVALEAVKSIYNNGPDLSWVYLWYTDDVAHQKGESEDFYNAIAYEDGLIGLIYDAVKLRAENFKEDWMIVVTTDHGRDPITAHHHGGQSDREKKTWIAINKKNINTYARNNRVAAVDIFPTLSSYLELKIPEQIRYELDGVSLIDKVDAHHLRAFIVNKTLRLSWIATDKNTKDTAKILVSYTNNRKKGKDDQYQKIATVAIKEQIANIPLEKLPNKKHIKIVFKTKNTTLNYWVK